MVCLQILAIVAVLGYFLYRWATKPLDTFEKRGIPFEKPVPLFGNAFNVIAKKSSFMKEIIAFYERNKHHKIVGFYNFLLPIFYINDPEYIKKICIKDFEHFPNHRPFIAVKNEPLVNSMLTIMKDQKWKDMRNTLTPVFTASKMRSMFNLMNESFDVSINHLKKSAVNGSPFDMELKQFCTRLSNDLIASTAFGLKINSYEDLDNEFYKIGQSITNFRGAQLMKFFFVATFPRLAELFGTRVFDAQKSTYFKRLVIEAMKQRQEKNIVRPDMIQLLMEAKKENPQWSDDDLVAQCFIFFFAAFENNANLICFVCHELAHNADIQQRLYEEVLEIKEELKGEHLNYDIVAKMNYMDMVVSETLRKWSLAGATDRVCSKDYKLYDDEGNFVFEFKEGDNVWFPIVGIQNDERYFEDPATFNPERFSEENKKNMVPFTYIPFGVGPRNCIGNRYALMQAKAMMYYLLVHFKIELSEKTSKDLLSEMRGFNVNPESGFWVRFVPRS